MDYEAVRRTHLVTHSRIDRTFEALADAVRSNPEGDAVAKIFERLRLQMIMHMDSEDRAVVPAFTEAHPAEAAEVAADHLELRRLIRELGDHVRQRDVTPAHVATFRTRFSLHEANEETGMYKWYAARHDGPFEHDHPSDDAAG